MFRQAITILVLTTDQIVRADFKGGQVEALWREPRPAVDDLPTLVDTALRLGGKRGRRVWVLTTDLWAQSLPLATEAARDLAAEEVQRVLAFEAEPLSGLSALESELGYRALASDGFHRHFWVVQLPSWQLEQIEETVERAGNTLAGVAHPGGLPRAIAAAQGQNWQRLELWSDNVVLLRAGGGKQPETLWINSPPHQDSWRDEAANWLAAGEPAQHTTLLFSRSSDGQRGLGIETAQLDLGDEAPLRDWLTAWADILSYREPGIPLLRPPVRPMSVQSRAVIAIALVALAVAGCFGVHQNLKNQIAQMQQETERLNRRTEAFESMQTEIDQLVEQRDQLVEETDQRRSELDAYEAGMDAQRRRIATFLSALAQHRPEHLMINSIEQNADKMIVTGVSLGPEPANDLAIALEQRVQPLGWKVIPAKQAAGSNLNGNPWNFELELVDVEVPLPNQLATAPDSEAVASDPKLGANR